MVSGVDIYRELARAQSWGVGGDLGDGWGGAFPCFLPFDGHLSGIDSGVAHVVLEIRQGTRQAGLLNPGSGGETDTE